MPPHHFFVVPEDVSAATAVLRGDEARHAARVLRVRPGEPVTLADDTGRILDAVISAAGDTVVAEVRGERFVPAPVPEIVLAQAVAKGERVEEAIEKAVEVGVCAVVPFLAERSIVRWDTAKRERATGRWRAVALAAAKQCRAPRLTRVEELRDDAASVVEAGGATLVLHEGAADRLRDKLPPAPPRRLTLVVGPEGGLSEREVGALRDAGAVPVTLGDRILRTQTAGVVAAAIVAHTYGSLG